MAYLISHWLVSLSGFLFLGLLAMALHETGHVLTSLMVGVKVKGVGLCMKGVYIIREAGTPAKNLFISLAGPLTNVALLILFWNASREFMLANMCFAVCNLVPVKGSDGDRALDCLRDMQKVAKPVVGTN
jgi:stage IV sporulation protein FB